MTSYSWVPIQSWMNRAEREIHTVFNDFARKLGDQKYNIIADIENWRTTQINQIEEHANKQKNILEHEYRKTEKLLHDTRYQSVNSASQFQSAYNDTKIDELIRNCKTLQLQLNELVFSTEEKVSIQYITEEKRIERDRRVTNKPENQFGRPNENYTANNPGASQTLAIWTQESATSTPASSTRPPTSSTSANSSDNNADDLPKCIVCMMIFPKEMPRDVRKKHIEEHCR